MINKSNFTFSNATPYFWNIVKKFKGKIMMLWFLWKPWPKWLPVKFVQLYTSDRAKDWKLQHFFLLNCQLERGNSQKWIRSNICRPHFRGISKLGTRNRSFILICKVDPFIPAFKRRRNICNLCKCHDKVLWYVWWKSNIYIWII